jgi:hypothetical protein
MPRFENGPLAPELPALSPVVTLCILGGLSALLGCGPLDDRVPSVVAPTAMEGVEPSVAGAGGSGEQRGVTVGNEGGTSGAAMTVAGEPPAGDASTGGSVGGAAASSCSEPCPPGASCNGDTCQCPGAQTACPDGCFDLQTDRQHCGGCSTTCRYGCAAGFCFNQIVEASPAATPERIDIAVNATHVYFARSQAGTVSRVLKDGTALQDLTGSQTLPRLITLGANDVYWTTATGSILRMPLGGGSPVELVTLPEPDALRPADIAVDATHVYWTNEGDLGFVAKVPLEGGSPTRLMDALTYPGAIAVDDTHVYWSNFFSTTDGGSSSLMKVPLDGGTGTVLASSLDPVTDIAVDAGQVYFVINNQYVRSVSRISSAGGPVTTLSANHATCMAVDSTGVYIGGAGEYQNSVVRYSLDAGGETVLGGGAFFANSIALDADSVFWSSALDGVRSTAKTP